MNNIKSKKNINHLKCFICGGAFCYLFSQKDFIYFISKKYFDLYECDSCKLVKILPEPTLDEIKSFYPKNYYVHNVDYEKSFIGWLYNCSIDASLNKHYKVPQPNLFYFFLAQFLKNLVVGAPLYPPKANGRFLDIGCGYGYWVERLQSHGWIAQGIDIMGKPSERIVIADFLEYEYEEKFEFIRMSGVLEHVIAPEKFIEKIGSLLLNNDSICQISIPQTDSFGYKYFKEDWIGFEVPRHLHSFNIDNLSVLFERYNMRIVDVSYNTSGGAFIHQLSLKWKMRFVVKLWVFFYFLFIPIDLLLKKMKKSVDVTLTVKKI